MWGWDLTIESWTWACPKNGELTPNLPPKWANFDREHDDKPSNVGYPPSKQSHGNRPISEGPKAHFHHMKLGDCSETTWKEEVSEVHEVCDLVI